MHHDKVLQGDPRQVIGLPFGQNCHLSLLPMQGPEKRPKILAKRTFHTMGLLAFKPKPWV